MTGEAFGVIAGMLSAMPAQQRWDDGVATLYAVALKDVPDSAGIEAVVSLVKQVDYRPSPALILRTVAQYINPELNPAKVWRRITRFLASVHPIERSKKQAEWISRGGLTEHDLVVVEHLGGWNAIGSRPYEENMKRFDAFEASVKPDEYVNTLTASNTKGITD